MRKKCFFLYKYFNGCRKWKRRRFTSVFCSLHFFATHVSPFIRFLFLSRWHLFNYKKQKMKKRIHLIKFINTRIVGACTALIKTNQNVVQKNKNHLTCNKFMLFSRSGTFTWIEHMCKTFGIAFENNNYTSLCCGWRQIKIFEIKKFRKFTWN